MPVGLQQIAAPGDEPVSTKEAKEWARIEIAEDDQLVGGLVKAARQWIENRTGMQLVTSTWLATYDRFPRYSQLGGLQYASEVLWSQRIPQTELAGRYWPDRASFRMPRPPLQAVSQIEYVDGATGNTFVMDPSLYLVDATTRPGRIAPIPGGIWPIVKQQVGAVQITYTAGYGGPGAVPDTLKTALKMLVAHWYANREAAQPGAMNEVPMAVEMLIASEWDGELF